LYNLKEGKTYILTHLAKASLIVVAFALKEKKEKETGYLISVMC
jgi:hypothetical protein